MVYSGWVALSKPELEVDVKANKIKEYSFSDALLFVTSASLVGGGSARLILNVHQSVSPSFSANPEFLFVLALLQLGFAYFSLMNLYDQGANPIWILLGWIGLCCTAYALTVYAVLPFYIALGI